VDDDNAAAAEAPEGAGASVSLAMARALAGSYVLKFKVRSALMSGAFSDGDDDDASECAEACIMHLKEELAAGAAMVASMTGGVPGSLSSVLELSCVDDSVLPENDDDMMEMMGDAHDCIASAWRAAADAAVGAAMRGVAEFCSDRAACHAHCSDCCDEQCDDDGGDDDDGEGAVEETAGIDPALALELLGEDFHKEIGHVVHAPKKKMPKARKSAMDRPGGRTPEQIHAATQAMLTASKHKRMTQPHVGSRTAAQIKAAGAAMSHGKAPHSGSDPVPRVGDRTQAEVSKGIATRMARKGKPLSMHTDLAAKAKQIGRAMPRADRRRVRHITDLTHAELSKKIAEMRHSG
jgi:hypothetical protein